MPKKKTPARKLWPKEELRELKAHSKAKMPAVEVAKAMKRTEATARQRLRRSGSVSVTHADAQFRSSHGASRRMAPRADLGR
jgi:hypothetical protein